MIISWMMLINWYQFQHQVYTPSVSSSPFILIFLKGPNPLSASHHWFHHSYCLYEQPTMGRAVGLGWLWCSWWFFAQGSQVLGIWGVGCHGVVFRSRSYLFSDLYTHQPSITDTVYWSSLIFD